MQNLSADLPAALSVMGILDVVRGPVTGYAGGRIEGPALGILAACRHRRAYPNALFVLSEPLVSFDGSVTAVAAREKQARVMLGELFGRIAEVAGRDANEVRADARRDKLFNVAEAIAYGLVESQVTSRGLPVLPGLAGRRRRRRRPRRRAARRRPGPGRRARLARWPRRACPRSRRAAAAAASAPSRRRSWPAGRPPAAGSRRSAGPRWPARPGPAAQQ